MDEITQEALAKQFDRGATPGDLVQLLVGRGCTVEAARRIAGDFLNSVYTDALGHPAQYE